MAVYMKAWKKPNSENHRIYFNNLPFQGSAKVWAEEAPQDVFGNEIRIRVRGYTHTRGEAGNLVNAAEEFINKLARKPVKLWKELLALL